jgi:hypothetical protein
VCDTDCHCDGLLIEHNSGSDDDGYDCDVCDTDCHCEVQLMGHIVVLIVMDMFVMYVIQIVIMR